MTNQGGGAVMLFNLNPSNAVQISLAATGVTRAGSVTVSAYDRSRNNVWTGITTRTLGAESLPLTLTLTPWSVTVAQFK